MKRMMRLLSVAVVVALVVAMISAMPAMAKKTTLGHDCGDPTSAFGTFGLGSGQKQHHDCAPGTRG